MLVLSTKTTLVKNNTPALTVILGKLLLETLGQAPLSPWHTLEWNETSRRGMCWDFSLPCAASGAHTEWKGVCWCYQSALNTLSVGFCQFPFASCKKSSNEFACWKGKYGFGQQVLFKHFGRRPIGKVNVEQIRPNLWPFAEGFRSYQLTGDFSSAWERCTGQPSEGIWLEVLI